ncbi:MAG TPA: hypothetical protein VLQ80_27275, partial [Candidatus Saccharimonadia bacterium]|nr:hypothetical protein [Candidatus Saccharimonadia bacterium]
MIRVLLSAPLCLQLRHPSLFTCRPEKWERAQAKLIAMRLGQPPKGLGRWTLQLLADQLVKLEVVESICPETV